MKLSRLDNLLLEARRSALPTSTKTFLSRTLVLPHRGPLARGSLHDAASASCAQSDDLTPPRLPTAQQRETLHNSAQQQKPDSIPSFWLAHNKTNTHYQQQEKPKGSIHTQTLQLTCSRCKTIHQKWQRARDTRKRDYNISKHHLHLPRSPIPLQASPLFLSTLHQPPHKENTLQQTFDPLQLLLEFEGMDRAHSPLLRGNLHRRYNKDRLIRRTARPSDSLSGASSAC